MLLGVAYSASIGGIGTLVGSPPNAIAARAAGIGFAQWLWIGLPMVLLLMPLMVLTLWMVLRPRLNQHITITATDVPWTWQRGLTLGVFFLTALGWTFGAEPLKNMGIQLAFDDFGVGQSRLNELAEVPPHVVKFDMSLIRDIDCATPKKQQMVAQLVQLVQSIGSIALAEGVETEAEAAFCQSIGFQLCQGFLTGKPKLV